MTATPVGLLSLRVDGTQRCPKNKAVPSRDAHWALSIAWGLGCVKTVQAAVGQSSSVVGASESRQYVHTFEGSWRIKGNPRGNSAL